MLKFIHQNSKIVTYVFLFVAVCFMFTGVSLDFFQSRKSRGSYAVKVNEREIPYREYERVRENIRERYRKMLGENFEKFMSSFNLNISRQALDSVLNNALLSEEAAAIGFVGSEDKVNEYLATKVFAGQEFSKEAVRGLLQSLGMNFKQFSAEVKEELSREAYVGLLEDVSILSEGEISAQYARQNTGYTVQAVKLSTDEFKSTITTPSDDVLRATYQKTALNYEQPSKVSYDYYVFSPALFEKEVIITPQDIEFYYSEHSSDFKTPEQARIKTITLLYPKESDPALMADVKTKAQKVHEEALAGKPFGELVQEYSEDLPTKLAGGDKGWVTRGSQSKEYDAAVFKASAQSVADLIETDYGYEIVYVEERKEATVKPLESVRNEIEAVLRKQEAPSYAAAKAHEIMATASKGGGEPLAKLISDKTSVVGQKATLLSGSNDPAPTLKGLTQQALQRPVAERLQPALYSVGDSSVLYQITEYKESTILPFEEVRASVLESYKAEQAKTASQKAAKDFLKLVQAKPADIETLAKEKKYTVAGPLEISRKNPSVGELQNLGPDFTKSIFSSDTAPRALDTVFKSPDGFVVAGVQKITRVDTTTPEVKKEIGEFTEGAREAGVQQTITSTLAMLKTRTLVDVDESILVQ